MKQNAFMHTRNSRWIHFEQLVKGRRKSMSREETELFPELYLQLCHDLSIARANNYSPSLVSRLNRLVHGGYRLLYKARTLSLRRVIHFWRLLFPEAVRRDIRGVLGTALLFYGAGLACFMIVRATPEAAYTIAGEDTLSSLEAMYNPQAERLHRARDAETDAGMFGYYIYNNVSIAFRIFAGGVFFGLGSLAILLFNGAFFGTAWAHLINSGYQETFISFVVGHGFLELNAFVLSGFAGLKLGWSVTVPGNLRRSTALRAASAKALPLVYGSAGMLTLAAAVEAFWSSKPYNMELKLWFAAAAALLVLFYFVFSGRKMNRAA